MWDVDLLQQKYHEVRYVLSPLLWKDILKHYMTGHEVPLLEDAIMKWRFLNMHVSYFEKLNNICGGTEDNIKKFSQEEEQSWVLKSLENGSPTRKTKSTVS